MSLFFDLVNCPFGIAAVRKGFTNDAFFLFLVDIFRCNAALSVELHPTFGVGDGAIGTVGIGLCAWLSR